MLCLSIQTNALSVYPNYALSVYPNQCSVCLSKPKLCPSTQTNALSVYPNQCSVCLSKPMLCLSIQTNTLSIQTNALFVSPNQWSACLSKPMLCLSIQTNALSEALSVYSNQCFVCLSKLMLSVCLSKPILCLSIQTSALSVNPNQCSVYTNERFGCPGTLRPHVSPSSMGIHNVGRVGRDRPRGKKHQMFLSVFRAIYFKGCCNRRNRKETSPN